MFPGWVKGFLDGPETSLPVYLEQRTSPDRPHVSNVSEKSRGYLLDKLVSQTEN